MFLKNEINISILKSLNYFATLRTHNISWQAVPVKHGAGVFRRGTFHRGTFHRGTFHRGTFHRGTFHRGTFHRGTFHRGTFRRQVRFVAKFVSPPA